MEAYRGLAILTTNLQERARPGVPAPAALRRALPVPRRGGARGDLAASFPPHAPLGELDFAALARLHLPGGNIRTIALNAAFAAARRGTCIDHPLLVDAARAEFAKLERSFAELGPGGVS